MAEPRGVSFPFRQEAGNFPQMDTGDDLVASGLKQLIVTEPGERRRRPNFGCRLRSFLFDPQDDVTKMAVQSEVFRAIRDAGTNVIVISIDVTFENQNSPNRQSKMAIAINYENLGRRDRVNLSVEA